MSSLDDTRSSASDGQAFTHTTTTQMQGQITETTVVAIADLWRPPPVRTEQPVVSTNSTPRSTTNQLSQPVVCWPQPLTLKKEANTWFPRTMPSLVQFLKSRYQFSLVVGKPNPTVSMEQPPEFKSYTNQHQDPKNEVLTIKRLHKRYEHREVDDDVEVLSRNFLNINFS
uniref:Uncharacterized protein n=1 Tax=Lactuca sativa TaxID=4236 RepID=A0A9R1VAL5_LACSA|nr:hypothetical protein LSAT_V11C500253510 [Lactuca sativa]